jgi:hypothetical protein
MLFLAIINNELIELIRIAYLLFGRNIELLKKNLFALRMLVSTITPWEKEFFQYLV